jgi:hypothetical protein
MWEAQNECKRISAEMSKASERECPTCRRAWPAKLARQRTEEVRGLHAAAEQRLRAAIVANDNGHMEYVGRREAALKQRGEVSKMLQSLVADRAAAAQHQRAKEELRSKSNELEAEQIEATVTAQRWKDALRSLQIAWASEVAQRLNHLLAPANRMLAGLLASPLELQDGELGRRVALAERERGGKAPVGAWLSLKTFSQTEALMACTGFVWAVCSDWPLRICLMDELGRFDEATLAALLERAAVWIGEGLIDQFIGAGAIAPAKLPKMVDIITL